MSWDVLSMNSIAVCAGFTGLEPVFACKTAPSAHRAFQRNGQQCLGFQGKFHGQFFQHGLAEAAHDQAVASCGSMPRCWQ